MIIEMSANGERFVFGRDPQTFPVEIGDKHGNRVIITADFLFMIVKLIGGAKGLKLND